MKRTNEYVDFDDESCDFANISLPSPQYSESELEMEVPPQSPTKKLRLPHQTHDLNVAIEDSVLEFVTPRGIERKKYRSQGRPLVLVFFGVMRDHLEQINDHHCTITRAFNAEIIGASTNLTNNEYLFPLINGTLVTKKFNARDPIGGGVYPRDMLVFFDKHGNKRHEVLLRYNGRSLIDRPVTELIKDVLEEMAAGEQMVH